MTNPQTRREFMATALTAAGALTLAGSKWAQAEPKKEEVKTGEQKTNAVKIAFITDTHTTRGTLNDQPQHKARFDRVIAAVNAWQPDWVLHGGDLTESAKPEEIEDFLGQIQAIKAPIDWVYGNHDVGAKLVEGQKSGLTKARVERIEKALGPFWWEKTRAGVRVVAANSSLLNSGLEREAEQWSFLEKSFAATSTLPTLFLSHYPPFIATPDEQEDPYWNLAPKPRARLLALLEKGGVNGLLSGHLHRPLDLKFQQTPLVVGPAVCFGLPRETQMIGWTKITVSADGKMSSQRESVDK